LFVILAPSLAQGEDDPALALPSPGDAVERREYDRYPHGFSDTLKERMRRDNPNASLEADGVADVWEWYTPSGHLLQRASDTLPWPLDGIVDTREFFDSTGNLVVVERQVPDAKAAIRGRTRTITASYFERTFYVDGKPVMSETGRSADQIDGWAYYVSGDTQRLVTEGDRNHDGRIDAWSSSDTAVLLSRQMLDTNYDGIIDMLHIRYPDRQEQVVDTDHDGILDERTVRFSSATSRGAIIREEEYRWDAGVEEWVLVNARVPGEAEGTWSTATGGQAVPLAPVLEQHECLTPPSAMQVDAVDGTGDAIAASHTVAAPREDMTPIITGNEAQPAASTASFASRLFAFTTGLVLAAALAWLLLRRRAGRRTA